MTKIAERISDFLKSKPGSETLGAPTIWSVFLTPCGLAFVPWERDTEGVLPVVLRGRGSPITV